MVAEEPQLPDKRQIQSVNENTYLKKQMSGDGTGKKERATHNTNLASFCMYISILIAVAMLFLGIFYLVLLWIDATVNHVSIDICLSMKFSYFCFTLNEADN